MSGQQIGSLVGGIIGAYFGMPQLGAAIGGYIGGVIDPTVIKGPSIGDAQQQTSQGGQPIPKCFGHCPPIAPTLIDGDPIARKYKKKSGGKGDTTQTEQEGFKATRAFLVCEGEALIARITRNGKLVYSAIEGDEIDSDSAKFASHITIYPGDETQGPDPSLEAIHGVGNTPYYRGRCYFVVKDDDETQTGGAANQYRIEVVGSGTATTNCTSVYGDAIFYYPLDDATRNGIARELISGNDGVYSDTPGVALGLPLRAGSQGSFQMSALADYMIADHSLSTDGQDLGFTSRPDWTVSCYFQITDPTKHGSVLTNIATYLHNSTADGWADWALRLTTDFHPQAAYTKANTITNTATSTGAANAGFLMATRSAAGDFRLYLNGGLIASDTEVVPTGQRGRYITVGGAFFPNSWGMVGCVSDVAGWDRVFTPDEVQAAYLALTGHYDMPDLPGAIVSESGIVKNVCAPRVDADPVQWKDIVTELARRASPLLPAHLDIDNMTDEVPGFVLGNATLTATDYVRTLCTFYTVDLPEYDDQLHAIRRGGAVVATFDPDDLLAVEDEDNDVRSPALQAYQRVTVMYPDPANKYVPTPQTSPRASPDVTTNNAVTIQCPIPFDATTMAQKADILQKIAFLTVEGTFKRAFPAQYSKYVASDAIVFNDRRHIITKASNDDCMVTFECSYDRPSAYTSTAVGSVAPPPQAPSSSSKGPTILAAWNGPALRTADNVPGIYLAVCGLLPGWTGADIYVSFDGGVTESLELTILDEATLGALDADCDSGATDLITTRIFHQHELSSVTDAQIAARANAFAILSSGVVEVGQFKTATETATAGTYDLTDLTRGELETTAAAHAMEDRFVLLDSNVKFLPVDESYGGQTLIIRAVTIGTLPANNPTASLVFDPPTFVIDGGGA